MSRRILQILSGKCRHEFAWPRKAAEGSYYQVCLVCGEEYQYDWPSMKRLGKRTERGAQDRSTAAHEDALPKTSWSPRARRLKSPIAIQFRSQGHSELHSGTIENISQSGLFLRAENCPAKSEVVEMTFEMPIEISGQRNSRVLCLGKVIRTTKPTDSNSASGCAISILEYHFVHDQERKKPHSAARPRKSPDQLANT